MIVDKESVVCGVVQCIDALQKGYVKFDRWFKNHKKAVYFCIFVPFISYLMLNPYHAAPKPLPEVNIITCNKVIWGNMAWNGDLTAEIIYERPIELGFQEKIRASNSKETITNNVTTNEVHLAHNFNLLHHGYWSIFWNAKEQNLTVIISYETSSFREDYTFQCDELYDEKAEILKNWFSEYLYRLTGVTKVHIFIFLLIVNLFVFNYLVNLYMPALSCLGVFLFANAVHIIEYLKKTF